MAQVPAYCDKCGLVFQAPISLGPNVRGVFSGNRVNCPSCGAWARIPDGIYNVLGQTIQILANSQRSARDIQRLVDLIQRAQDKNQSPEEIKATIQEHAPELKRILDLLPRNRSDFYAAVSALTNVLLVLAAFAGLYIASKQGLNKEQVEEIIRKSLEKQGTTTDVRSIKRETITIGAEPTKVPTKTSPSPKPKRSRGRRPAKH